MEDLTLDHGTKGRDWPFFPDAELASPDVGWACMYEPFMRRLVTLREMYGKPVRISSGYRTVRHHHDIYQKLGRTPPGASPHLFGCAVDVAVEGAAAYEVGRLAFMLGFTGILVNQPFGVRHGNFIHLDYITGADVPDRLKNARPAFKSY